VTYKLKTGVYGKKTKRKDSVVGETVISFHLISKKKAWSGGPGNGGKGNMEEKNVRGKGRVCKKRGGRRTTALWKSIYEIKKTHRLGLEIQIAFIWKKEDSFKG